MSELPDLFTWTTQGHPVWDRNGQIGDITGERPEQVDWFLLSSEFSKTRKRGKRFSLGEDKGIGMFENFQMNPHHGGNSARSAEALLLMVLSPRAPCSRGPHVPSWAPGRFCPAWS